MTKNSKGAKVLLLDIETAPGIAYWWSLFDRYIPVDRIVEPGYTLCYAAKWLGEKDVEFRSLPADGKDALLDRAWELLSEADVVIHYNGRKFDIPTLNREFVQTDYLPPVEFKQIDLLEVVRKQFRFSSNKLDFVAEQLGLGTKVKHRGFELWKECMDENHPNHAQAWAEMEEYNVRDVALLEDLYEVLRPWVHNHPNLGLFARQQEHGHICPHCESTNVIKQGIRRTQTRTYQRFQCLDCGSWSRGRKSLHMPPDSILVPGHPR